MDESYPPDNDCPLFVGVDPSAKKIAIVAHHPVLYSTAAQAYVLYKNSEKQTTASLGRAVAAMEKFLEYIQPWSGGPKYAWVEDPLVGRGGALTTMKQAYVGGIIRGTLANAGFKVYGVNVSTWKKEVCGSGRAQKPDVARAVRMRWPKVVPLLGGDGDLTDAAAINLYAQEVVRKSAAIGAAGPT